MMEPWRQLVDKYETYEDMQMVGESIPPMGGGDIYDEFADAWAVDPNSVPAQIQLDPEFMATVLRRQAAGDGRYANYRPATYNELFPPPKIPRVPPPPNYQWPGGSQRYDSATNTYITEENKTPAQLAAEKRRSLLRAYMFGESVSPEDLQSLAFRDQLGPLGTVAPGRMTQIGGYQTSLKDLLAKDVEKAYEDTTRDINDVFAARNFFGSTPHTRALLEAGQSKADALKQATDTAAIESEKLKASDENLKMQILGASEQGYGADMDRALAASNAALSSSQGAQGLQDARERFRTGAALDSFNRQRDTQMGLLQATQDRAFQRGQMQAQIRAQKKGRGGRAAMGAASGAASGAMLGSVVPGIGTVVGGVVGGLLGAAGGYYS